MDHVVTVRPPDGSDPGTDLSCLVDQVTINHGRDDTGSQPEASSATVNFTVTQPDPLPAVVEIGSQITVTTTTPTTTSTRFVGRITDLSLGWEDAAEATPDAGIGQLVAVGILADLGRRVVGDAPYPQELDGARISRIMAAAGITLDPLYSDPGTVQIIARDIDSQPALDVAHDAAASSSGVLWTTRGGLVRYADAVHRRGIPSTLTLDACDILITPSWRRTLEGLVNDVSIGYGVAPDGGEQPRYTATDTTSQGRYGHYGYSVTTALAALADAQAMGQLLLVRNSSPVWVMAALPVDVPSLTPAQYDALLGLDLHSLLVLTGLPAISSAPTTANLWVEGWKETLTYGAHDIELVVSGYCRTVPAPRWDDVDPAWVWGGESVSEQRRNLITNPSFETGATGWGTNPTYWTNAGATLTVDNTWSVVGAASGRVDCDGTATQQGVTATITGVAAATTVIVSATIRNVSGRPVLLRVRDTVNAINYQSAPTVAPGTTARVIAPITTGAQPTTLLIGVTTDFTAAASTFHVDGVLAEIASTVGTYFDGDTADYPGADFAWTGPPGASASSLTGRKELRRNLTTNPAPASLTGWNSAGAGSVLTYTATGGPTGAGYVHTVTDGTAANQGLYYQLFVTGMPAGTTFTASIALRQPSGTVKIPVYLRINYTDAALTQSPITDITPGASWGRFSTGALAANPAGTLSNLQVFVRLNGTAAITFDAGQVIVEAVPPGAVGGSYFDGGTTDEPSIDYAWTGPPNASPSVQTEITVTTGGLPATLTWDGASCLGPPVNYGRWDDQPATLRWDQIPATTTWNNYGS